jgi:hypothetical protein
MARRFPPPWSVEELEVCFVVHGGDIDDFAVNIAKLPEVLRKA